jgi:hypothetical protein
MTGLRAHLTGRIQAAQVGRDRARHGKRWRIADAGAR